MSETSGGDAWAWNQARAAFLRRLAGDARRPGLSLLIAETTALAGYAYGARRVQRRLLADHGAALGVTLVAARDARTVETMRSWGWRTAGDDTLPAMPPAVPPGPFRVLVLAPGT
ncbi:hypothetical protein ABZ619_03735 [Streptomyces sp. NPDC007851]|uniref:hypothetical protein n=1 Tax=Streptomyces sp. NPDC007851 TaxID=3155008 RepID=UPI0033C4BFB5